MQIANETTEIIIASLKTLETRPIDGLCGARKLNQTRIEHERFVQALPSTDGVDNLHFVPTVEIEKMRG